MREEDSRQKYTLCHVAQSSLSTRQLRLRLSALGYPPFGAQQLCHVAQLIKNNVSYLLIMTYNDFKIRPPLTYC